MRTAVDFERLEAARDALGEEFRAAHPYPHVVIDNLLTADGAAAAYDDFDRIGDGNWTKYLHVNERKFANTDPTTWGGALETLAAELQCDRFVGFLSAISGVDELLADLDMDGGGLHRSGRGGYLNVHADFTAHHDHDHWRRRINLILYLNREWRPEWGGDLEVWSTDMKTCERTIAPVGNRALIFATSDDSFHGHPEPMTCPEGVARQSLALYYFTDEPERHVLSTNYRPRPDDGLKSVAIALDRQALRVYDTVKRRLRLSDGVTSRWLDRIDRLRPGRRRHDA